MIQNHIPNVWFFSHIIHHVGGWVFDDIEIEINNELSVFDLDEI